MRYFSSNQPVYPPTTRMLCLFLVPSLLMLGCISSSVEAKPKQECYGELHGIPCCEEDFVVGDNAGDEELFIQADEYVSSCIHTCKSLYPSSVGITESRREQYSSGPGTNKNKCWCEFGRGKLDSSNQGYKTCMFGDSVWHSDDVDGALGWGRTFKSFTLHRLIGIMSDDITRENCCSRCLKDSYGRGTEFMRYEFESCTCYKRYEGKRPVTEPDGSESGLCGQHDIKVQGRLGKGWYLQDSQSWYGWKGKTTDKVGEVWNHSVDVSTPAKCCQECAKKNVTELFNLNQFKCSCHVTIPGKKPKTEKEFSSMVDACV